MVKEKLLFQKGSRLFYVYYGLVKKEPNRALKSVEVWKIIIPLGTCNYLCVYCHIFSQEKGCINDNSEFIKFLAVYTYITINNWPPWQSTFISGWIFSQEFYINQSFSGKILKWMELAWKPHGTLFRYF